MSARDRAVEARLAAFEDVSARWRTEEPNWLTHARRRSIERFRELGFPTTKSEEWRYTDVRELAAPEFVPQDAREFVPQGPREFVPQASREFVPRDPREFVPRDPREFVPQGSREFVPQASREFVPQDAREFVPQGSREFVPQGFLRLSFIDGALDSAASAVSVAPNVEVSGVARLIRTAPDALEPWLSEGAGREEHGLLALHGAFFRDGALIRVKQGATGAPAIHLAFFSTEERGGSMIAPRNLILLEPGTRATVFITYRGAPNARAWVNARTEIELGEGSSLELLELIEQPPLGRHLGTYRARQRKSSRFIHNSTSLTGALTRTEVTAELAEERAACTLNGLYLGDGKRHADCRTVIDHLAPRCTSRELYKGVLGGNARGVFNGLVRVRPGADGTDAAQTNKNLLFSETAIAHTRPQLEILAHDVKCMHGAAVGRLDADQLFYLRSRGLDAREAKRVLAIAFASEVLEGIESPDLRAFIEARVTQELERQLSVGTVQ